MRRMLFGTLAIACVVAGCRVPAPPGVGQAEAADLEDDINTALAFLVAGTVIAIVEGVSAAQSHSTEEPAEAADAARIKAQLDRERARGWRASRPR